MTKENKFAMNDPKLLRVLMVEDSEDDTLLVLRALKKGGFEPEYERVETAAAMEKALSQKQWDIILCDYKLPEFSATAAIAVFKKINFDIPLIIVSGAIGEETAVECMRLGAHDYIMKGNLSRLCPAVTRELEEADSRSKRKQAESQRETALEALRQEEEKYRTILENIDDGYYEVDLRGNFTFFNNSMCRILGYPQKEMIGMNNRQFTDKTNAKKLFQTFNEVYRTGTPAKEFDWQIIRKDGTGRYIEVSVTLQKNSSGRPIGFRGIARDITERKQADEALKESEEKFRSLFENSLMGISAATTDGRLIHANMAYAQMYGYDNPAQMMTEVIDVGHQLYAHPEQRDEGLRVLTEKGIMEPAEVEVVRRDGTRFFVLVTAREIRDTGGNLLYYQATHLDITERKQSFERMRKALRATVQAISLTVEMKDPYTSGHQRRVADLARSIAMEMGLSAERRDLIRTASTIHDIGKIAIPTEILSKPTKLTELEFNLIKTHSRAGYDILKDIEFPWPVADVVFQHHERLDGSGYPRGLKGDEILLEARILGIADVVEAIASHRPYRPALGIDIALEEISGKKGILYDAAAVDACLKLFREKGYNMVHTS